MDNLGASYKYAPRFSVPYMSFINKNLIGDNVSYDDVLFFDNNEKSIKVAFFGGSTGEPIKEEYFSKVLSDLMQRKVTVKNFSCTSSNHRQHMHMILELLPKYNPDIVIFYGGVNEGTQYLWYDPRPGYPYNNYYKLETSPVKKLLIEHSALISSIEYRYHNITSRKKLRDKYLRDKNKWFNDIYEKYFETLKLSKNITESMNSETYGNTKFIAFYQPYRIDKVPDFESVHNLIRERIKQIPYVFDIFNSYDEYTDSIWEDYCHVYPESGANEHIANVMANIIYKEFPLPTEQ